MDRLLKFIGFLTCIVGIIYAANWLMQHFPKYIEPTLQGLGVVALLVLFVRLYLGRDWLMKLGKEFVIGSDLIKASENFLNDLPKPKNETTANFIGHLVYRFTRLGLIGLMLALIPITLLYQQNQLLSGQTERIDIQNRLINDQNRLVTQQNKRLDQQTYLQEAERRSSLVFLFSNIMDGIDKELKDDYGDDGIRNLSPQLIGRIVSLSTRLKPYNYLDRDTLIANPISPERGQLLVSLYGSKLDSLTMEDIYSRADFSSADLVGANLNKANLAGANLINANLSNADLSNANLRSVNLRYSNLIRTNLNATDLRNATVENANLYEADLVEADLRHATFYNSILVSSDLRRTNLPYVDLIGANLNGAIIEKYQYDMNDTTGLNFIVEYFELDSIVDYAYSKNYIYKLYHKNESTLY